MTIGWKYLSPLIELKRGVDAEFHPKKDLLIP
jgi:hypothetical protein